MPVDPAIEEETFLNAQLASVSGTDCVELHLEDGGTATFRASTDVANTARQYLGRTVYAMVTFKHQGEKRYPKQVLEISPVNAEGYITASIEQVRNSLSSDGIKVTCEWLKS